MSYIVATGFEGDDSIRGNGTHWSVFDIIRVIGGQVNPRKAYKRLVEQYPEVVAFCYNLKFPGKGQRETPVVDREGALRIIGLLPGAVGKKYREAAAKLFIGYMDGDVTLAEEIYDRASDKDQRWLAMRLQGKEVRKQLTAVYKEHNANYASCTNRTYGGLFNTDANGLRKQLNVKNPRDGMTMFQLSAVAMAEEGATTIIKKRQSRGNYECGRDTEEAARIVKEAMDKINSIE